MEIVYTLVALFVFIGFLIGVLEANRAAVSRDKAERKKQEDKAKRY